MPIVRCCMLVVALGWPVVVSAQVLDAPTGTYKGTLVRERRLTLKQTDPPRVVSLKQKTKLLGFGYVPQGGTRTFLRLVVPPRGLRDRGVDSHVTVDFTPDPPVVTVADPEGPTPIGFPAVRVEGNVVTVETITTGGTADYLIDEIAILTLKRTKP